jgi:hypothetical protein
LQARACKTGLASQGALRFAEAMKKPHGTILRGLAYGP